MDLVLRLYLIYGYSAIGFFTSTFNFHSRGVSERFALMAIGNYERYRREGADNSTAIDGCLAPYIQWCKASVYGSAPCDSTPALRLPKHRILW